VGDDRIPANYRLGIGIHPKILEGFTFPFEIQKTQHRGDIAFRLGSEYAYAFENEDYGTAIRAGIDDGAFSVGAGLRFKQFMLDLLMNAVEAIGDGIGTIKVEIEEQDTSESARNSTDFEWVRLSISDDGPGLPPTLTDKIFEPFFSTKKGGTGLGLPIVRRIVENLGGRIEFETRNRHGRFAPRAAGTPSEVW
jgi:signal transduction histidine kinase